MKVTANLRPPKRGDDEWMYRLPKFLQRMVCPDVSSAAELARIDLEAKRLETRVRLVQEKVSILRASVEARAEQSYEVRNHAYLE